MKILFVDTYYSFFLKDYYKKSISLSKKNYKVQSDKLLSSFFGTSDSYSFFLRKNNIEADDIIVNCIELQNQWAKENGKTLIKFSSKIPHKLSKFPIIGKNFIDFKGIINIASEQIKKYNPEILYIQDISFFPPQILSEIKKDNNIRLVVGQIACPLPSKSFLKPFDLILSSFPHFVKQFKEEGINSEYFKIGFDQRILSNFKKIKKDIKFSFVGGISRHHSYALNNIKYLLSNANLEIYGYGAKNLQFNSIIRKQHKGEKWGLEMYEILARSEISFNRHINIALNNANNMRLFEATGMGSLLLTDEKNNLNKLFEIDKEILTYRSKEEALEKYKYLINHPSEINKIAKAGQARTLKEHTYEVRMLELIHILKKHLKK